MCYAIKWYYNVPIMDYKKMLQTLLIGSIDVLCTLCSHGNAVFQKKNDELVYSLA